MLTGDSSYGSESLTLVCSSLLLFMDMVVVLGSQQMMFFPYGHQGLYSTGCEIEILSICTTTMETSTADATNSHYLP
ncbi:hypothetical protein HanOQP8_Chr02g0054021 [Helianthus annuus]|nr:hypothetical protein HanOQP8_Chr02g0054021 [Helianthus annuus]